VAQDDSFPKIALRTLWTLYSDSIAHTLATYLWAPYFRNDNPFRLIRWKLWQYFWLRSFDFFLSILIFNKSDAGKLHTWLKLFRGFDQVAATKGLASFKCCSHFQRLWIISFYHFSKNFYSAHPNIFNFVNVLITFQTNV
jgi:hypothetical protein